MLREIPVIFVRNPSACAVCKRQDPHLSVINGLLRRQARNRGTGKGVKFLASEYSLSVRSLRLHRDRCLALASVFAAKPKKATEEVESA